MWRAVVPYTLRLWHKSFLNLLGAKVIHRGYAVVDTISPPSLGALDSGCGIKPGIR